MSHKKVVSQGSVPFSWEVKPGISKLNPTNMNLNAPHVLVQPQTSSFPNAHYSDRRNSKLTMVDHGAAEILPPPPSSKRNIWQQQDSDPFLAAIKQCTKSSGSSQSSKRILGLWKSKFVLSCKYACDVREDNLVMMTTKPFTNNLPPLPRRRLR